MTHEELQNAIRKIIELSEEDALKVKMSVRVAMELINQHVKEVIGEDEKTQGDYVIDSKSTWLEAKIKNQLRAEQRKAAGL